MKKLFISQPMRDKSDEDIRVERAQAKEAVEARLKERVEVIDSFFEGCPHEATPLWYLGKSLEMLSQADVAYFVHDWQKYRGCKIEHDACVAYGIETFYE